VTGFHTEIGAPTVPSYESVVKFLPENALMPMGNNTWSFHDYCDGNGTPSNYTNAMQTMYGAQSTIQNVCKVAQLMNYDEYRAYMEALQVKRFANSGASGLLLWMSNCVWPSLMWQTYDYYLEGTGAFYGCMEGAEPLHVMYYASDNVEVANNTIQNISNYTVEAATYNLDGTKAWSNSKSITVNADEKASVFPITKGSSTPYFLDLKLKDADGNMVSKNFYWLPNTNSNKSQMLSMQKATLAMTTEKSTWDRTGTENTISFKIVNTSAVCAVHCRFKLTGATSGERILPCHFNDNYVSLAPGDTHSAEIKFDEIDRNNEEPKLVVSGINVDETDLAVGTIIPVVYHNTTGLKIPQFSILFVNGALYLQNLQNNSPWNVVLYDMRGRVILTRKGTASGSDVHVPTTIRPGLYVAICRSGAASQKSVLAVTR
jgi:exo-1,4-beta-D-glucosaminidase